MTLSASQCLSIHRWVGGEAGELCSIGELQLSSAGEGSVEVGAGALVAQLVAWGRREGWQVARGLEEFRPLFQVGSSPIPTHLSVGGAVASLSHGAGAGR